MKLHNPLDKFTSHSIHYIMLGAASTSDLNPFNNPVEDGSSPSLDAIDKAKFLGDAVSFKGTTAYLILDTRRFSQFVVSDMKTVVKPTGITTDPNSSPNGVTTEFQFNVVDPMGILFSNFLQFIMEQKLQVSFEGMACLFKVVFVGHLADGTTETVGSVSMPCFFHTIKLDLLDSRGVYECSMIPLIGANSAASHRKWTNIGSASKFFTGSNSNTLDDVIKSFEKSLNAQSAKMYENVNKNNADGEKIGRKVEYMITIPDKWKKFQMTGPNQGRVEETDFVKILKNKESESKAQQQKQEVDSPAKESNISVEPSMSIMQTLDVIFSQCVELAKIGNIEDKKSADSVTFYKMVVNVTSDSESFMVHVDVVEFVVPNVNKAKQLKSGAPEYFYTSTKNGITTTVPKNAVEYDYTFSGTNIDVLDLVLNFENLNYMLQSPVKIGSAAMFNKSTANGQNQKNETGEKNTSNKLANGIRKNDPVLLSEKTWAEDKNFSNVARNVKVGTEDPKEIHQQYIRNLAAYYSSGQAPEVSTSIRGNPYLFMSSSLSYMVPHYKFSEENKVKYRSEFEENITKIRGLENMPRTSENSGQFTGGNLIAGPMFVKINIYGPNLDVENKGMLTNEVDPAVDYSKLYFDNNYYFVSSIESEISGGTIFKHTLQLLPFGIFGTQLKEEANAKKY